MPSERWSEIEKKVPTHTCSPKCSSTDGWFDLDKKCTTEGDDCPFCGEPIVKVAESTRINMILSRWVKAEVRDASVIPEKSCAGHVSLRSRKNDDRYLSDI